MFAVIVMSMTSRSLSISSITKLYWKYFLLSLNIRREIQIEIKKDKKNFYRVELYSEKVKDR